MSLYCLDAPFLAILSLCLFFFFFFNFSLLLGSNRKYSSFEEINKLLVLSEQCLIFQLLVFGFGGKTAELANAPL